MEQQLRSDRSEWSRGPIITLDIETGVCASSVSSMRSAPQRPLSHFVLNEVRAAAALIFITEGEGATFSLHSVDGADEAANLQFVEELLNQHPDAAVLTFNGHRHDLPVLEIRALRQAMFDAKGLRTLQRRHHYGLLQVLGGHCSLDSYLSALRIGGLNMRPFPGRSTSARVRKCEYDVVATFLGFSNLMTFRAGAPEILLRHWRLLREYLLRPGIGRPHLANLFDAID